MANRMPVVNRLRPRIVGQGAIDLEEISRRVSKNTTFNLDEIYSVLRQFAREALAALKSGETIKVDGLVNLGPNMKVGGAVDMRMRPHRSAIAELNDPTLWTADRVANHENLTKTMDELVMQWDQEHPGDTVVD